MKVGYAVAIIVLAVGAIFTSMSMFVVDETEQAIVLQLGQPVGDVKGPGLHFKIPVVQDVRRFDSRILAVDPRPQQMVISSASDSPLHDMPGAEQILEETPSPTASVVSGEPIIVDTFSRYRIIDPLKFMKTLRTVPAANQRIEGIINEATRTVLGRTTLRRLLSEERTGVMRDIQARVNSKIEADNLGVEIIDIRIVRADLTPELRASTVRRMISELRERATETRAKGEERALEISSTAEKERTILLADAERQAQILRGEGDELAIKTYAEAFNKDQEFYGFIRSLEAYRETMANEDTRLILNPDSEFFEYFRNSN